MSTFEGFPTGTIKFLRELEKNNNREWFAQHKQRYEDFFLDPAIGFIEAMQKPLAKFAPLLLAEPKKQGGSLMRIYRDTRFSKDKQPYKTNIGIQFRHVAGKDVHAPGVYLHVAAKECFLGVGMWKPASDALKLIRQRIVDDPQAWRRTATNKRFNECFELYDDRLKSVPRGFDKSDPNIDDLRLKSFLGLAKLERKLVQSSDLVKESTQLIKSAKPLMVFLCQALGQPY